MAYSASKQLLDSRIGPGQFNKFAALTTATLDQQGLYLHAEMLSKMNLFKGNTGDNPNYSTLSGAVVVYLYEKWEMKFRKKLAQILNMSRMDVKIPLFGDLRTLRNVIIHSDSQLSQKDGEKLSVLKGFFQDRRSIELSPIALKVIKEALVDSIIRFASGSSNYHNLISDQRLFSLCIPAVDVNCIYKVVYE